MTSGGSGRPMFNSAQFTSMYNLGLSRKMRYTVDPALRGSQAHM